MPGNILNLLSTFSVLIPIGVFLFFDKQLKSSLRFFFWFLVLGFSIDVLSWILVEFKAYQYIWYIRIFYSFIEACVFAHYLMEFENKLLFNKAKKRVAFGLLVILWLIFIPGSQLWLEEINLIYFETTTGILFTFGGALVLLHLIEKGGQVYLETPFWIAFGIFFYNISTFFVAGLLGTSAGVFIYKIHNVINLFSNLIFAFSFTLLKESVNKD